MFKQIYKKYKFDVSADRLGPDCTFTHWRLYFKPKMQKLCKKKFKNFGDNSEFRAGAYAIACSKISIGNNVVIRPNSMIFGDSRREDVGNVTIEDNVLIGSNVHIFVSNHRFDQKGLDIIDQGHYDAENVVLKRGCWIGASVIILPGVTIGENSVVGGGSVVTKSIPDRCVAVGCPAKVVKKLDEQGK